MKALSDAQIRAQAQFVDQVRAAHSITEVRGFYLLQRITALAGIHLHLVRWPNGVVVAAPAESKEEPDWSAIIAAYRSAERGERGCFDSRVSSPGNAGD